MGYAYVGGENLPMKTEFCPPAGRVYVDSALHYAY